jgi:hypothetical protein
MNIKNLKSLFFKNWIVNTYSLDLFQTYTNVPIIYLKHYYKSTLKNFNINLSFKIIKNKVVVTPFMDLSIVFGHNHEDG